MAELPDSDLVVAARLLRGLQLTQRKERLMGNPGTFGFTGIFASLWISSLILSLTPTLAADTAPVMTGSPAGNLLVGGSGRVMILSPEGKVLWEQKAGLVHDAWMLPNGNVLYADSSVTEVTPDHKVVFHFQPEVGEGGGAYACQRLENGNTLIGENSTGRVLEVDPAGKIVFKLDVQPSKQGSHENMRMARKLKNGNYLVCQKGYKVVREYTPAGVMVSEFPLTNIAFAAFRTPQNTTFISSLDHVTEYDAGGKKVWELANTDIPNVVITNMTGMQLLPNGSLVIGCYAAYHGKEGTGLFEVTRDKKLVWRYADPGADGSLMAVECLDKNNKPVFDPALR
jgi:hypothetical protein